ncbi:hypothetical protein HC823_01665 [Candidatus Gracilibacteria bacterium]|nr:hypothetical protein [Candidatus Gracilibacteria bacterium]
MRRLSSHDQRSIDALRTYKIDAQEGKGVHEGDTEEQRRKAIKQYDLDIKEITKRVPRKVKNVIAGFFGHQGDGKHKKIPEITPWDKISIISAL